MKDVPPASRSEFDAPATYRISVQGRIPARWLDRLEGMTHHGMLTESRADCDHVVW